MSKTRLSFRLPLPALDLDLAAGAVFWLLLVLTSVAAFVPLFPMMPTAGIDASWVYGMNEATGKGLVFGKEIIFTFGPYSSIYSKTYHPQTDLLMVGGSLFLALMYCASLVPLVRSGPQRWWGLVSCVMLAEIMYSRDSLLFLLPLVAGLAVSKLLLPQAGTTEKPKMLPLQVALLLSPFGLLPLIKGSLLLLCVAIAALCALLCLATRQRRLALVCVLSPSLAMLLFWVLAGQAAADLPGYFIAIAPVISGYTEAMSADGNFHEINSYLFTAVFVLLTIAVQTRVRGIGKLFLLCLYFLFLFLSFKAGFIRHDFHAVTSSTSILSAALLLPLFFGTRIALPAVIFACLSWFYIDGHYVKTDADRITGSFRSTYESAWYGLMDRAENTGKLKHSFDAAVLALKAQAPFPALPGTSDIYSFNQSYLIASGSHWSPRPLLQSYSVYTPALAEINRQHLLGSKAPDNIIFKPEAIDGRLPPLEDGPSWPVLIANYAPVSMKDDFLLLKKKPGIGESIAPAAWRSETHAFGESVSVSGSGQKIFAQLDIEPTMSGRLANFIFKPDQLKIMLELKDGTHRQYRFVAGMAKSGFLLSPLVEDSAEFAMLYGKEGLLEAKQIKSFSIVPANPDSKLWQKSYTLKLSRLASTATVDISSVYRFDEFDTQLAGSGAPTASACKGSIDKVNNITPAPDQLTATGLLRLNGWAVTSIEQSTLPEAVYVVLTDKQGRQQFLTTRSSPRPDLAAYLGKPGLVNAGYTTVADLSGLNGSYTLGLAMKSAGKIMVCPEFKIAVTFSP